MSKKRKISLILIAVFVVLLASASAISYSVATKQSKKNNSNGKEAADSASNENGVELSNMEYTSNIDLIIGNSEKSEKLNIVEIFAEDEYTTSSGLASCISNGGFQSNVIDANSGKDASMKKSMISYTPIAINGDTNVSDVYSDDSEKTIQDYLNDADLIYLTSKKSDSYKGKMSESVYTWLSNYALNSHKPIVVDYTEETAKESGNNYANLLNSFVSDTGTAKYSNVLPVADSFFGTLGSKKNKEEASAVGEQVANLLNISNYRDTAEEGLNGKIFRVLELQPCYPIDTQLAAANGSMSSYAATEYGISGNYYMDTDNVTYNFALTKAKIAAATGLTEDQIEVVCMSTEEFVSTSEPVLGEYDLIYIGGDTTALNYFRFKEFGKFNNKSLSAGVFDFTTSFDMYTHTGNVVELTTVPSSTGLYETTSSNPYGVVRYNDSVLNTGVALNGNDLTTLKKNELLDYIEAGMPVVFDEVISKAYDNIKDKGRLQQLAQHDIDPDSQMYQLLKEVSDKHLSSGTIVWGASPNMTGTTKTKVVAAINKAQTRPNMVISTAPKKYVEGDESSYNTSGTFKVEVSADSANEFDFYVDEDSDGIFEDNERMDTQSGTAASFSYTLERTYVGKLNWKVVARNSKDANGVGCYDYVSRVSFFRPDEEFEKNTTSILQIMPVPEEKTVKNITDDKTKTGASLYFCTECQHALHRAEYNIQLNGGSSLDWDSGASNKNTYGLNSIYAGNEKFNLGLHEHTFGIVKYDEAKEDEDWDYNFAEEAIIKDHYDVDLDILYVDEFEEIVEEVHKNNQMSPIMVDGKKVTYQEYYAAQAADSLQKWEKAQADLISSGTEEKLKEWLQKNLDSKFTQRDLDNGEYYEYFIKHSSAYNSSSEVAQLYQDYIKYKDAEVTAHNEYKKFSRLASISGTWLGENYDTIILGPAEDFGGTDLSSTAAEDIKTFVNNGGTLLATHDTTTRYEDSGTQNLTMALREAFGQDRFHMDDHEAIEYGATVAPQLADVAFDVDYTYKGSTKKHTFSDKYFSVTDVDASGNISYKNKEATIKYTTNPATSHTSQTVHTENVYNLDAPKGDWTGPISSYVTTGQQVVLNFKNKYGEDVYPKLMVNTGGQNLVCEEILRPGYDYKLQVQCIFKDYAGGRGVKEVFKEENKTTIPGFVVWRNAILVKGTPTPNGKAYATVSSVTDLAGSELGVCGYGTNYQTWYFLNLDDESTFMAGNNTAYPSSGDKNFNGVYDVTGDPSRGRGYGPFAFCPADLEWNIYMKIAYTDYHSGESAAALESRRSGIPFGSRIKMTYDMDIQAYVGEIPVEHGQEGGLLKYLKYDLKTGYSDSVYYLTDWSSLPETSSATETREKGTETREQRIQWQKKYKSTVADKFDNLGFRSAVGVTDAVAIFNTNDRNSSPYRYAEYDFARAVSWNHDWELNEKDAGGTNRASQVNDGPVLHFPFDIGSEIKISPNHSQYFALDLEENEYSNVTVNKVKGTKDSNITVYYALAGAAKEKNTKQDSSLYAASPRDGMDSYFLYGSQYGTGNIYYCGSGHSILTGAKRDNNDERRLLINLALNVVNRMSIDVYNRCDTDSDDCEDGVPKELGAGESAGFHKLYIAKDGMYEYCVDSKTAIPQFDFKVRSNKRIKNVQVYYDTDYDEDKLNMYTADADHVEIYYKDNYKPGTRTRLRETDTTIPKLPLQEEYFKGSTHTYIVVCATDAKGNKMYKRIRIKYIQELFDLTDATFDFGRQYCTTYSTKMDMTDKTKFNI